MDTHHFAEQIQKTGFVLENQIAKHLKAAGWTVISNRYYVDDSEESVREIDLVAYQVKRVQHLDVYTALIISCKKSESNAWALLCRDIDLKDPNSNWQPLHAWSNDKSIAFQLAKPDAARNYHNAISKSGAGDAMRVPQVEVFAFQEMNKVSGAPQNDKKIFEATTSLMKAQAYELGALPQRRINPAIYQFNLLSIVDSDLIRLLFEADKIAATQVEQEHYIACYIISKEAMFSRIRFLRADTFQKFLPEYAALHQANCDWFNGQCNDFYADIVKDNKRAEILIAELREEIRWAIRSALTSKKLPASDTENLWFYWTEKDACIRICAPFGSDGAQTLNADLTLRQKVAQTLRNIYRYSGNFEFEDDDFPF